MSIELKLAMQSTFRKHGFSIFLNAYSYYDLQAYYDFAKSD